MERGTHAKLMFVTEKGTVLGAAEMLNAESWVLQPFRFVSLDNADKCRLRAAIESSFGGGGQLKFGSCSLSKTF